MKKLITILLATMCLSSCKLYDHVAQNTTGTVIKVDDKISEVSLTGKKLWKAEKLKQYFNVLVFQVDVLKGEIIGTGIFKEPIDPKELPAKVRALIKEKK